MNSVFRFALLSFAQQILLLNNLYTESKWYWQNPLPQVTSDFLAGISFSDVNHGTIVGGAGMIYHTTDGEAI